MDVNRRILNWLKNLNKFLIKNKLAKLTDVPWCKNCIEGNELNESRSAWKTHKIQSKHTEVSLVKSIYKHFHLFIGAHCASLGCLW